MKLLIILMFASLMTGCATSADIQSLQSQISVIGHRQENSDSDKYAAADKIDKENDTGVYAYSIPKRYIK